MESLMRELTNLGFSEKEAAVYLAALELGPSPVQDIARRARVNRATTYVAIDALSERGLMSSATKGKKRLFVAEGPERLRTILRLQRKELEEKESELESVLPLLFALVNAEGAKPHIRYLEGEEGLQTVRDLFSSLKGEAVQILPHDAVEALEPLKRKRQQHIEKLVSSGGGYRGLVVMDEPDPSVLPGIPGGEVRAISAGKFPIRAEISVRGNHVFLFSYATTVLSVVIISKEIAGAVRALFDLAWEGVDRAGTA